MPFKKTLMLSRHQTIEIFHSIHLTITLNTFGRNLIAQLVGNGYDDILIGCMCYNSKTNNVKKKKSNCD